MKEKFIIPEKTTLPMPLPICKKKGHGQMILRPLNRQSKEQKWCGAWYDCLYCGNSVCYPTIECMNFLNV